MGKAHGSTGLGPESADSDCKQDKSVWLKMRSLGSELTVTERWRAVLFRSCAFWGQNRYRITRREYAAMCRKQYGRERGFLLGTAFCCIQLLVGYSLWDLVWKNCAFCWSQLFGEGMCFFVSVYIIII